MVTTFKIWTAATTNAQWSPKLQNFLLSANPKSEDELKIAVESFLGK